MHVQGDRFFGVPQNDKCAPFHTNILLSVAVVLRFDIKRRNEVSVFEGSIALFVKAYGQ